MAVPYQGQHSQIPPYLGMMRPLASKPFLYQGQRARQAGELVSIRMGDGSPIVFGVLQDEPQWFSPRLSNPSLAEIAGAQYTADHELVTFSGGGRLITDPTPCLGLCDRSDCKEWTDVWVPKGNTRTEAQRARLSGCWDGVLYHVSECQMADAFL